MKKLNPYLICLFILLIIALLLRTCTSGLFHYTHDELSALSRTGYGSFSELLQQGVINDLHPPLVQIFMHYWTALVGHEEWIVKLPFMLLGMITLYQTACLTRKWFGDSTALLSVALMSVVEFHIYHSQTARPYTIGLFFCLLFYQAWSALLFSPYHWKNVLLFSISAAGAAYTHHCAGLAVAITGFVGFLYIKKSNLLPYLLGGVLSVVLYLPNFALLIPQLQTLDKVGHTIWLAAPTSDFLYQFLAYLLHFSWPFLIITLVALSYSLFSKKDHAYLLPRSLPYTLFLIFLMQFGLIFWYSIATSPVLQFSSLFFVFPLAVAAVFSAWKRIVPEVSLYLIIAAILISGIYSLLVTRQYNKVTDTQAYEAYHDVTKQILQQYPEAKTSILLHTERYFQEFYMRKKQFSYSFHDYKKGFNRIELIEVLKQEQPDIVILGDPLTGYTEELMQNGYPYLIHHQEGQNYEIYILSKQPKSSSSTLISKVVNGPLTDTMEVASENEWPATIRIPLDTLIEQPYNHVIAGVWVKADTSCKALVYLNFKNENGESVDFRGSPLTEAALNPGWNYVTIGVPIWVLRLKGKTNLETAVWNIQHNTFSICGFSVFAEKGNVLRYAVVEPPSGKLWNW